MPSAIKYVPATSVEREEFSAGVAAEKIRRRTEYETALKYYNGEHTPQLEIDEDFPDDNTYINLVRITADRTAMFLFPEMPSFEIDPSTVEDTPEEAWVHEFFKANGGLGLFTKLTIRGFLSGHNFVKVSPIPANKRGKLRQFPRISVLDPTSVTIFWRADDIADVIWYEYRYMVGSVPHIQDFVQTEAGDWRIITYKAKEGKTYSMNQRTHHGRLDAIGSFSDGDWELVGTAKHMSDIPPIIEWGHLPHPDSRYGLTEAGQTDLQDAINRVASERNRIVRETSDPVDVMTGADVDEVQSTGGLVTVPNPAARVQRLQLSSDLSAVTATLDKMIETYLAIARVVLLKGEAKDLQRVTNASVRTLFLDALAKNEILKDAYGEGLARVAELALQMGYAAGYVQNNPSNMIVDVRFKTPLPIDLSEVANINALGLNGKYMSKRTAATRLNLDWQFETSAMEGEHEEDKRRFVEQQELAASMAQPVEEEDSLTDKKAVI